MNSRERVLAALAHERPDRTPRDFWAEDPSWNRLLNHTGHPNREAALRALGIDLRLLDADGPPDRELGGGVFQNCWGERYVYQETGWGPMREDLPGALAGAESRADLEAFPWPHPDQRDYRRLRAQCDAHPEHALVYGFADVWQRPALVRGWEGMFVDMIEHPDRVHFLCRKFTDFYLEDYTRAAEATQGRFDLYLLISDLGSQRGPLISRPMFQEFVAPYLREMTDRIHQLGAKILFHCCGAIRQFIDDLIALGIDVLNPIQPTGPDMAPESLQAAFGGRVVFHGGIDMQRLLPQGSPEEVAAEARRYCATLGEQGGYILAPAHRFQPDVPPENILALYTGAFQSP
jgi:uroporphyrinogen decarboxylase